MNFVKSVKSLFSFLTILPVGRGDLELSARAFYLVPMVGLVEGGIAGVLLSLLKLFNLPTDVISALYIATHVTITRGMHLDGYTDYLDAIGSLKRGEDAVRIMKDPRKGSFSITVLIASMIISYASMKKLASLELVTLIPLLIFIYASAAESMYIIAAVGKEEPYRGLAYMFSKYAKQVNNIIINAIVYWVVLLLVLIINTRVLLQALIIVVTTLTVCLISYRDSKHRVGFITGDIMGFTYELTRFSCLLVASITM